MKKLKVLTQVLMALSIVFGVFSGTVTYVKASDQNQDIKIFTEVTVIADVPEGYDKEVVVQFKSDEETIKCLLQPAQDYTSVQWIKEGIYETSAQRKNSTDFSCEIPETCEVQGQKMEFRFTVLPVLEEVTESNAQEILDNIDNKSVGSDVNGLESGQEIIQEFIENTAYFENTEYFKMKYSKLTENESWKKEFLNFQGDNFTEEKWNSMGNYQILMYRELFYLPYVRILNTNISNEEEFVEAATLISLVRKKQDGEAFADAMEKVIRWQWKYYEHTGTLYNFFAEEGKENAHFNQQETPVQTELTVEEQKEISELREELLEGQDIKEVMEEEEQQSNNRLLDVIKNHMTAIIVLVISGIAIIAISLYIKHKKNSEA